MQDNTIKSRSVDLKQINVASKQHKNFNDSKFGKSKFTGHNHAPHSNSHMGEKTKLFTTIVLCIIVLFLLIYAFSSWDY